MKNYPSTFKPGTIFETYPYLLPNLVCATIVVFGLAVGILFFEETHEDIKHERDRGLEAGKWILSKVLRQENVLISDKDGSLDEMQAMLEDHGIREYHSTSSSPTLCSSRTSIKEPSLYSLDKSEAAPPKLRDAFTRQVCLNVVAYGILALYVALARFGEVY